MQTVYIVFQEHSPYPFSNPSMEILRVCATKTDAKDYMNKHLEKLREGLSCDDRVQVGNRVICIDFSEGGWLSVFIEEYPVR